MAEQATSPEVIVVGGGIAGTSIAWRLAESGRRVLLLERRGICAGASGRNAGMTGAGSSMHATSRAGRAVYAITMANLKYYHFPILVRGRSGRACLHQSLPSHPGMGHRQGGVE